MTRYTMVMGKQRTKKKKDDPDIMRWVLNLVVPLMTLFGILNLVVSGEAVEGLYKFFKNKGTGTGVHENNPYYAARAGFQNQLNHRNMNQNYQNYGPAAYGGNSQGFGQGQPGMPNQNSQISQQNLGQMEQQAPFGSSAQNGGQMVNFPQYGNQVGMGSQQSSNNIAGPQSFSQIQQNNQPSNQLPNSSLSNQAVDLPLPPQKLNSAMEKAPEVSLLAPPDTKGITLNKYKTSEGDKDDDLDEDKNEDADFKPGLDFNDMQFDDSYKAPECPNLDGHDWSEKIEPKYKLDPEKFLVPVLFFGPNNQIHGLRESIILAIKLNRTIALPPFYKHKSANSDNATPYSELVEASHRIDERALRKLVPIVKIEDLREKCGSWFGVAFLARQVTCSGNMFDRLSSFEYFAKIHLLNHATLDNLRTAMTEGNCKLLSVPEQPPSESLQKGRGLMLPDDPIALQTKIYKSDEKCAAFLFPFKNYIFDPLVVKSQAETLSPDMTDLMKDVINNTPRPQYIKEVATMFIDEVISNGDFVAIHWRYDKDDWLAANCKDENSAFMKQKCDQIHEAREDGTILARGVAKLMEFLKQRGGTKSKIVYIATPVAEEETVNSITDWLNRNTDIKILSSLHLQTFFDHFYSECDVTSRDWLDLLSILEQEVMYRSTVFIRSVVSSWSLNVQLQRSIEGRDKHDVTNWRLLGA